MEVRLLELLVCPICKGPLEYLRPPAGERPEADALRRPPPEGDQQSGKATFAHAQHELVCRADRLAFPVRDGIPVMLEDQARALEPAA